MGSCFVEKFCLIKVSSETLKNLKGGGAHWALESREVILKSQIWKVLKNCAVMCCRQCSIAGSEQVPPATAK